MPEAPPALKPIPGEGQSQTAIRAQLDKLFPTGVIPDNFPKMASQVPAAAPVQPALPVQPVAPVQPVIPPSIPPPDGITGPPAATGPITPAPGPTGPAVTGATGPAATGATGPAATGVSGPTGPTKLTQEQLDKAAETFTAKAGSAFKQVRGDLAIAEAKRKELEAENTELRAKAAAVDAKKVKDLEDRVKRYEEELAVSNVEATDEFVQKIATPLKQTADGLKALATKYEINPADLETALSEPDQNKRSDKLSELSTNFNRLDMTRFDMLVRERDDLQAAHKAALDGAQGKYAELQAQRAEATKNQEAKFKADWSRALTDSYTKLEEAIPVFKQTGDEGWDKMVMEARDKVKATDVAALSNDELAERFYKAEVFPLVLSIVSDLHQKNVSLDAQLTKMRGSTPSPGDGITPAAEPIEPKKYASMEELLKDKLQGVLPR